MELNIACNVLMLSSVSELMIRSLLFCLQVLAGFKISGLFTVFMIQCEVVLFVKRICSEWDNAPPNMRKALGYKESMTLHTACGMFLYFLEALQKKCPASEFPAIKEKLHESFMMGLMDGELFSSAETSVPPGDVCSVSHFRPGRD